MVFDLSGNEYCKQRTTNTTQNYQINERGIIMIIMSKEILCHKGYFIHIMPKPNDRAMININGMRVRRDCLTCQNKEAVLKAIEICHLENDIEVVDFWVQDDGTIIDHYAISILDKSTFKTDLDEFLKVYEELA